MPRWLNWYSTGLENRHLRKGIRVRIPGAASWVISVMAARRIPTPKIPVRIGYDLLNLIIYAACPGGEEAVCYTVGRKRFAGSNPVRSADGDRWCCHFYPCGPDGKGGAFRMQRLQVRILPGIADPVAQSGLRRRSAKPIPRVQIPPGSLCVGVWRKGRRIRL